MDFIDRTFIINLNSRVDRMNDMEKLMETLGIYNWERFPAIKPKFKNIDPELYSGYNPLMKLNKKYVKGSIGCKLSHIEVIKLAKAKHYKNILILEDDVDFVGNLEYINIGIRELDHIERWDILYLGLNKAKYKEITNLVFLNKVKSGLCTHAYIVNNKSYTKIIKLLENSTKQIDVTYNENFDKLNCYIIPNQFKQNKSFSDINRIRF